MSGAQDYEQLCISAKTKEKRLSALRKHQEFEGKGGRGRSSFREKERTQTSGDNQVRIKDTRSKAQLASVNIQGMPVEGITDKGANITILGGYLFKRVASMVQLRKKDFRRPDKTPQTYDRRSFTLHGCMDLDITFGDKIMSTPVYVKMDSSTPYFYRKVCAASLAFQAITPQYK